MERFEAPVDIRRFLPDVRTDSLFEIAPTITLSLRRLRGVDPVTSGFWTLARAQDRHGSQGRSAGLHGLQQFSGMEHMHDAYDRMVVYGHPSARACRFR
jgi:hypothetical protein